VSPVAAPMAASAPELVSPKAAWAPVSAPAPAAALFDQGNGA